MFDPQSLVCLTSVSTPYRAQAWHAFRFVCPGTVRRGELQHGTHAYARAQARSTYTDLYEAQLTQKLDFLFVVAGARQD